MKRALLVGDADPALAESPFSVLYARKLISLDQYEAGLRYAWLRWSQFGKGVPGIGSYSDMVGGGHDEPADKPDQEWLAEAFKRADGALWGVGSRGRSAVRNVAVFAHLPRWLISLLQGPRRESDALTHGLFLKGLDALSRHFATTSRVA